MRLMLVLFCGLNLFPINNSLADTKAGSVGRYADGRAYRVDSQGYQLSDQIAELEATIKEQETQISSCENELAGKGVLPKVAAQCPKMECPDSKLPVSVQPTAELCSPFTALLNSEVADLRAKLSKAPRAETFGALSEESIQLRQTLSAAEDNAKASLKAEKAKLAQLEEKNEQLNSKLAELSAEIEHKNKRESELLASLDKLSAQLAGNSSPGKIPARGMLSSRPPTEAPTTISITREESTDNKAAIISRLAEIQKLVIKRKDIFDSARTTKKGITIQMQPLLTENGVSLDQLRQRANIETSEFGALSHGLNEIKKILISDIQVMERLIQHL